MPIDLSGINYEKAKEQVIQFDEFKGGTNVILKDTRIKDNEAAQNTNLMLVQDGIWTKRWGTEYYTGDAGGTTVDGFAEYVKTDGTRELIIVANGVVRKVSGTTWATISGATFTAGTKAYLIQIGSELYIANGTDTLARYDGTSLSTYTELSAPGWAGTPLARGAGLSAGNYTQYYQVTALNEVGETVGSTEQSITTDAERADWVAADNDKITLDWNAVSGATRYQVYWSDESGYEVLLATSTDTGYVDDGTATANTFIEVPDDNTTGAPKFTHMWLSGNRLWATGDPDNKFRVYFSGVGQFLGFFSDYYGGGWVDLEKGGRHEPVAGVHYHNGQGVGRSTILASTPEGIGSIWQVTLGDATIGDETFVVPSAAKIVGSIGTSAPRSVVQAENNVFFLNKRGIFALGPEAQYWGILRTNELSVRIRPYLTALNDAALDGACGYYIDGKVFFSVPTTSSGNDRIIYYDLERKVWIEDWSTGVTQFGEFTDENGKTHFLGGTNDDGYLVEFDETFEGDLGTAFSTTYLSARRAVSDDWSKYAKIKKARIRLSQPRGTINFEVRGTEKRAGLKSLKTASITPDFSQTGMGWDKMGTVQLGDTNGTPQTFSQDALQRYVVINKRLRDIQFRITTSGLSDNYTLLGLQARGFPIETRPPTTEKL